MVSWSQSVSWQTKYLVTGLSRKTQKTNTQEINRLVAHNGVDALVSVLKKLLEDCPLHDRQRGNNARPEDTKTMFLQSTVHSLENSEENFGAIVVQAIEQAYRNFTEELAVGFCRVGKVSPRGQLSTGLAALMSPQDTPRREGAKFLRAKLRELSATNGSGLKQLPLLLLSGLISVLSGSELCEISEEREREQFIKALIENNPEHDYTTGPLAGPVHPLNPALGKAASSKSSGSKSKLHDVTFLDTGKGSGSESVRACDIVAELLPGCADVQDAVLTVLQGFPHISKAGAESNQSIAEIVCVVVSQARSPDGSDNRGLVSGVFVASAKAHWNDPALPALLSGKEAAASNALESPAKLCVEGTIDALKSIVTSESRWHDIFELMFDLPEFNLNTEAAYEAFHISFARACGREAPFPLQLVLKSHKNTRAQLCFLQRAIYAGWWCHNWAPVGPQIEPIAGLSNAGSIAQQWWGGTKLLGVLFDLAEQEDFGAVRELFDEPLASHPEALLIAACMVPASGSALQTSIIQHVAPQVFDVESTYSTIVQAELAKRAPAQLRRLLGAMYLKSPVTSFPRVVDILAKPQLTGFRKQLLDSVVPTDVTFPLVLHLYARGCLSLSEWAKGVLRDHPDEAATAMAKLLKVRLKSAPGGEQESEGELPLWPQDVDRSQMVQDLIWAMQEVQPSLSQEASERVNEVKAEARRAFPSMPPAPPSEAPPAPTHRPPPKSSPPAPRGPPPGPPPQSLVVPDIMEEEVEEHNSVIESAASDYFRQIYAQQMTVIELVDLLRKFSVAEEGSYEYEVYQRMVQNLFEECRFFPKYPAEELSITGELFGSLINNDLVQPNNLGLALRCVLEALRRPMSTKMFRFGITALEHMLEKLPTWPQLCHHLTQLEHLNDEYPRYIQYAEDILESLPEELRHATSLKPEQLYNFNVPATPERLPPRDGPVTSVPATPTATGGSVALPGQQQQQQQPRPQSPPPPAARTGGSRVQPPERPPPPPPHAVPPAPNRAPMPAPKAIVANHDPSPAKAKAAPAPVRIIEPEPPTNLPLSAVGPGLCGPFLLGGAATNEAQTTDALLNLQDLDIEPPPSQFHDQVVQIFNSLSSENVDQMAERLRKVLVTNKAHLKWLAYYMVKSRASKEVNFLPQYLDLFEKLREPKLLDIATNLTYDMLRILLRAVDQATQSTMHRSALKNLGYWLGQVTLGRSKALKSKHLDLKSLLLEAHRTGRLTAVLPMVCKVMEGVQRSRIHRLPNPFTEGILGLLAEIHDIPNLRTNLVFEVEVLCKHLGVKVADLTRTEMLKGWRVPDNSNDISKGTQGAARGGSGGEARTADTTPAHQQRDGGPSLQPPVQTSTSGGGLLRVEAEAWQGGPLGGLGGDGAGGAYQSSSLGGLGYPSTSEHASNQFPPAPERARPAPVAAAVSPDDFVLATLPQLVSTTHQIFTQQPALRTPVAAALDRAIKEVIPAVVERSVTISCLTTTQMVSKDFAMDGDETVLNKAAELMVASVSGALALVTCREPLRVSLTNHFGHTFRHLQDLDINLQEFATFLASENLDLGCAIIEKAVIDKASAEIENHIESLVEERRQHRERKPGVPYADPAFYAPNERWPAALPEVLRPRAPLSAEELKVYRDFNNMPTSANRFRLPSNSPPLNTSVLQQLGSARLDSPNFNTPQLLPPAASLELLERREPEPQRTAPAVPLAPDVAQVVLGVLQMTSQVIDDLTADPPLLPPIDCNNASSLYRTDDSLDACVALGLLPLDHSLCTLLRDIPAQLSQCSSKETCIIEITRRLWKRLCDVPNAAPISHPPDCLSPLHLMIEVYLSMLALLARMRRDNVVAKTLTGWLDDFNGPKDSHLDIISGLLRYDLLIVDNFDRTLKRWIDGRGARDCGAIMNCPVVDFAVMLLENACLRQRVLLVGDLPSAMESLIHQAARCKTQASMEAAPVSVQEEQLADTVSKIVEEARAAEMPIHNGEQQRPTKPKTLNVRFSERADEEERKSRAEQPTLSHEQMIEFFEGWRVAYSSSEMTGQQQTLIAAAREKLQQLQTEESMERFLRVLIEHSVKLSRPEASRDRHEDPEAELDFSAVDVFVKFVVSLMKMFVADMPKMFNFALTNIAKALKKDCEVQRPPSAGSNQRAYYRMLFMLLMEACAPEPQLENASFQLFTAFANMLHTISPRKVPLFAFGWLELVSNRLFMPKVLRVSNQRGWLMYQRLIVQQLHFMQPYLQAAQLDDATRLLYQGTMRTLLVLLHDFPEFLCDYHYTFCNILPVPCVQIRNLILSAFPRNMRLPEPLKPNLKVDLLPEVKKPPRVLADYVPCLVRTGLKADVDAYMRTRDTRLLESIKQKLQLPRGEESQPGRCNTSLMNALLLYVGNSPTSSNIAIGQEKYDVLFYLAHHLDHESRYLFLSEIANHLRFPNTHTHYFSCALLYIFVDTEQDGTPFVPMDAASREVVQEQITRVLLERLIVHRPHPWGLLITFVELIKNRRYAFWTRGFVTCAPEVEKLFQSVAHTCLGGIQHTSVDQLSESNRDSDR
eukprot:TRINITY_DN5810_c0_g1_i1.p1 TRINITY_DN5810_c0_g1~~TRINITY_DN5810_c0_g1_i1.p1  ORF type:complete len:2534 (+),score=627.08 TRINITY_DN5810_c0_g1_i1:150-7751(+)